MTYAEHIARSGRVMLIRISAVWCGVHGAPKGLGQSQFFYHISTTELPEQQEKPGNKKNLSD